jgi:hypothetical protein
MTPIVYIGLDTATISGIALWYPQTNRARVVQVKGDPIETFGFLIRTIMPMVKGKEQRLCMELTHHFQNAKTTRSICERYGFIKYSMRCNYPLLQIHEVGASEARKNLGTKGKESTFMKLHSHYVGPYFTDNHADALAVAMFQSVRDGFPIDWAALRILPLEMTNEKAR